jgi:hypothetical protein
MIKVDEAIVKISEDKILENSLLCTMSICVCLCVYLCVGVGVGVCVGG